MVELKPGDKLIASSRYHGYRTVEVLRVTKTQIIVFDYSETKLRNPFHDGCWPIGARGYANTSYYMPTPELMGKIERQNMLANANKIVFANLSNNQLKQILEIAK